MSQTIEQVAAIAAEHFKELPAKDWAALIEQAIHTFVDPLESDRKEAAGGLSVNIDEMPPGSTLAKVVCANRILIGERDKARALVASYDRQDELIGTEFEGVDEVTDVIRLLKQERDELQAKLTSLSLGALKTAQCPYCNQAIYHFTGELPWTAVQYKEADAACAQHDQICPKSPLRIERDQLKAKLDQNDLDFDQIASICFKSGASTADGTALSAVQDLTAKYDARKKAVTLLHTLDRLGGLGLDIHNEIERVLSAVQAPQTTNSESKE